MRHRPRSLRLRLLATLLLVATGVIVVFDLATVTVLRDWQIRRVDGHLVQLVQSHRDRADELLAGMPQPFISHLPNDYYLAVATADRGVVPIVTSDVSPVLPADLDNVARSGSTRTVPGGDGRSEFLVRAVSTSVGILVVAANLRTVTDAIYPLQVILLVATVAAMALLAVGGLAVLRHGLRPLEDMAARADRITAGDLSRSVVPQSPDTEVGRLGQALNRMLGRIHSSVEDQRHAQEGMRQFFADASHELRTPLTSLRVNAELYEQGVLTSKAEVDEVMHRIRVSAHRMSVLVDDMLRLARLDQHPQRQTAPIDLTRLLAESLSDARATDGDRTWVADLEPELVVHGDADLLRRAIDNLLGNVHLHTPRGTSATLSARRQGDQVRIDVADDGPGVPDDALPHLFDRFYRVGHTDNGSGLGLAIVAEVAAAHGGTATVTAHTPRGLHVRLTLPAGGRILPSP